MVKKIKQNKWSFITTFACFIVGIIFCISKRAFDVDESLSFALANNPSGWVTFDTYGLYDKSLWSYTATTPFNYKMVWLNQYFDVHPPLYYYLLHTISSLFPNRFTIWFGLIINLLFYLLDLIIISIILNKLTKNDMLSAFGTALFGLNKITTANLTYIRMYMMSSFFVLLFLYFGLKTINKDGNKYINEMGLFLTTICGGLTHYHFYFIIACMCLFFGVYLLINKRFIDLLLSFMGVFVAFLLNIFVFFTGTIYHLNNADHANNAKNAIKSLGMPLETLKSYVDVSFGGLFMFLLMIVVLACAVFIYIKKRNKNIINILIILLSYFLSFLLISKTSTGVYQYYVFPIESLMIIGLISSLSLLPKVNYVKYIEYSFIVIFTLININYSYIIDNIGTIKSWDVAKEYQESTALVITGDKIEDYKINELFTDLRWYSQTGITQLDKELKIDTKKDLIIYIQKGLDEDAVTSYLKRNITNYNNFTIEKLDINKNRFNVYLATYNA